jgi:hypothetical protein
MKTFILRAVLMSLRCSLVSYLRHTFLSIVMHGVSRCVVVIIITMIIRDHHQKDESTGQLRCVLLAGKTAND